MKRFRDTHSLESRREQCERIRQHFPDHVPVIVEPFRKSDDRLSNFGKVKTKFLVSRLQTFGAFLANFRQTHDLGVDESLFFITQDGNIIPSTSQNVSQFAAQHADPEDKFLYLFHARENSFGSTIL